MALVVVRPVGDVGDAVIEGRLSVPVISDAGASFVSVVTVAATDTDTVAGVKSPADSDTDAVGVESPSDSDKDAVGAPPSPKTGRGPL